MRKQKLRRLLAVLLTLCLLLGCVPAVFAADQTKELGAAADACFHLS